MRKQAGGECVLCGSGMGYRFLALSLEGIRSPRSIPILLTHSQLGKIKRTRSSSTSNGFGTSAHSEILLRFPVCRRRCGAPSAWRHRNPHASTSSAQGEQRRCQTRRHDSSLNSLGIFTPMLPMDRYNCLTDFTVSYDSCGNYRTVEVDRENAWSGRWMLRRNERRHATLPLSTDWRSGHCRNSL